MDAPELTRQFVTLASMDNSLIVWYYKYVIIPIVRRYVKKSDHLLDLGCGGGVLLTLLRQQGYKNLYGIDAAQILLDRIPNKTIMTVCDDYLNMKKHYENKQFDAATVFNTLHHLDSEKKLREFFLNLYYILKPKGVVIVKELHEGLVYKVYRFLTYRFSPSRRFVWEKEAEMHARFFNHFADCLDEILREGWRYRVLKECRPYGFERVIVLEVR